MSIAPQYSPAAYSLTAIGVWGASDFLGGVGARRANAFLFTAIVHLSGMLFIGTIALITHAVFPENASVAWALMAGAVGGFALAIFYRSLAQGNMGLGAPVFPLLGAGIPRVFTAFPYRVPSSPSVFGFILSGMCRLLL